jgi:FSR family fosmidomycin resistance protein-like MFS transporter
MLLAGAAGTLTAGPAADRFGRRPVLLVSNIIVPPAIAVFILAGGVASAISLVVVGAAVVGTFGVTMVMSQEYMPQHIGMASGLSIGLSIGLGGIAAVMLGAIADSVDLETALWVCAAVPLAGLVLTLLLPPTRARSHLAPEIASP